MKLKVVITPLATERQIHVHAQDVKKSLTETEVITNLFIKLPSIPLWQKFTIFTVNSGIKLLH